MWKSTSEDFEWIHADCGTMNIDPQSACTRKNRVDAVVVYSSIQLMDSVEYHVNNCKHDIP